MSTTSFLLSAALVVGGCSLIGCGNGQDRRAETVTSSAAVATNVMTAKVDLDGVVGELKNLRDASDSADLKKMHAGLKERSAQLNKGVDHVIASSDDTVATGRAQQMTWHQQADTFTDANLRTSSQKREGNLRTAVDELGAANAALKGERDSFVSLLNQTVTALDLDLSQQGVQGIHPTLAKLVDNEPKFRDALTAVSDKVKAVSSALNP